jgi:hypothetical protein
MMVASATHASLAASTHAASTHAAATAHAVTASAGMVTAMVRTRVRRASVWRLIGIGQHPIAAEIDRRIRRGRYRQDSQQAKRKNNTHAHILSPENSRGYQRTSVPDADLHSEKRGNQT